MGFPHSRWRPDMELLEYLLRPTARHRNDVSCQQQLRLAPRTDRLPRGLELQWLGTAGFRLAYEGYTVLIDPYFSRRGLRETFSQRPLRSDAALAARLAPRADAILVGHTHFDHALDVPGIAARCGSRVLGSTSLVHLMQLHDLASQATAVEPYRVYELGPFSVTFVPSRHSKLLLGFTGFAEGELTCDCLDHLGYGEYRCGQVWGIHIEVGGKTFYHQGSADLVEDAMVHRDIDVFLCGIAGRGYTPDYVARVLSRLSPRSVIAHHHDSFFVPLDRPMKFSLNVNLGKFAEEVRAVSADFDIATMDLLQTVEGA